MAEKSTLKSMNPESKQPSAKQAAPHTPPVSLVHELVIDLLKENDLSGRQRAEPRCQGAACCL
jgi:hypothetical protein